MNCIPQQLKNLTKECFAKECLKNLRNANIKQEAVLQRDHNHSKLQEELQLGAKIQQLLLLGQVPTQSERLSIAAFTQASKTIDGDFFDFFQPAPHIIDIALGDVMGKGLPAALVATAVKTQMTRFASPPQNIHRYSKDVGWHNAILEPEEIIQRVHEEINQTLMQLDHFVCLIYGRFNLDLGLLKYVDCGSAKPIHYQTNQRKAHLLNGVNLPIGVIPEHAYQSHEISFTKNDLFLFYSDGVSEMRAENNEMFGVERLMELVEKHHEKETSELIEEIKQEIIEFSNKKEFNDDLTLIAVKIKTEPVFPFDALSYPADIQELPRLRQFIRNICKRGKGDTETLAWQMELCIDEAFCNIIDHAYKKNKNERIYIQAQHTPNGILFDLYDTGDTFDPKNIQEPDFLGEHIGGYGLFMIKEISDNVTYIQKTHHQGHNRLRIEKKYIKSREKTDENSP